MKNSKKAPPKQPVVSEQPVVSVKRSRVAQSTALVSILTKNAKKSANRLKSKGKATLAGSKHLDNAKNEIALYREIFSKHVPGAQEFPKSPVGGHFDLLMRQLSSLPFLNESSERPADSIQEDLMKYSGVQDIETQYEKARQSARRIFFDCATKLLLQFVKTEGGEISRAMWRALLILDPNIILKSKEVGGYLADGIVSGRGNFLKELAKDFSNVDRRKKKYDCDGDLLGPSINAEVWVMAAFWTNPHCPLWLMERPAIYDACKLLSQGGIWTQNTVDNFIRRHRFFRNRSAPIRRVRDHAGYAIKGYELRNGRFTALGGKQYPVCLCQPLALADLKVVESQFSQGSRVPAGYKVYIEQNK